MEVASLFLGEVMDESYQGWLEKNDKFEWDFFMEELCISLEVPQEKTLSKNSISSHKPALF